MDRAAVKDRGKKHIRSKNRYKGNKYTKETTQLPVRQEALPSNHDRYDSSDNEEQTTGADFALLASAPLSVGGHFQFKNDSLQSTVDSMDSSSKYLQSFDADLLSYSLKTIPFHIRCNVDSKYITEECKKKLCEDAERNKSIYEEYLKHLKNKTSLQKNSNKDTEKLLNMMKDVIVEDKSSEEKKVEDPERAELEDWLDDVLNS